MLITIRNEEQLSKKANYILGVLSLNSNMKYLHVFKKESQMFREKWETDQIQLASSPRGLITYYFLILLKSPKDYLNGIMRRLSLIEPKYSLIGQGFLSMLSRTLYLRFGTQAQVDKIMSFIQCSKEPKVFLIDEFISLKCIDLKKLKKLGYPIVYISQDTAYNRFGYGDNLITRKLMYTLEKESISHFSLVVACSEMERIKYVEMGAKNTIFYPNIYPTNGFRPTKKDKVPSISIVLREHWGSRANQSLEIIFRAISLLEIPIKVYLIGTKPAKIPKSIKVEYYSFLKNKSSYLSILSKSWIGLNVGIHLAGTNERKYDYAEAGTVVISDILGSRGDLLPYEYTYVDYQDLASKLRQLLDLGENILTKMGNKNRKIAIRLAQRKLSEILNTFSKFSF